MTLNLPALYPRGIDKSHDADRLANLAHIREVDADPAIGALWAEARLLQIAVTRLRRGDAAVGSIAGHVERIREHFERVADLLDDDTAFDREDDRR